PRQWVVCSLLSRPPRPSRLPARRASCGEHPGLPDDPQNCTTPRTPENTRARRSHPMTETPRMNVESFNLDHRTVAAPYLRIADRKELPGGDVLTKLDVRFTQPNTEHLDSEAVHSLEHMMAEHMRNHSEDVLDVSPIGCRTGFYVRLVGDHTPEGFAPVLEATLNDLLAADEVPAANEIQCGWGAHHSLEGAKTAARAFLDQREAWGQVTAG